MAAGSPVREFQLSPMAFFICRNVLGFEAFTSCSMCTQSVSIGEMSGEYGGQQQKGSLVLLFRGAPRVEQSTKGIDGCKRVECAAAKMI